ncbi:PfkB family carbohydrate kinase [Nitratireductor sp. GCM10026969]|uniref:PfkB family carbohydrate kinase n=1 Tax=Nitratireductor sp. GCM10026969 TaxID=3252645 RepID=UPI003617A05E
MRRRKIREAAAHADALLCDANLSADAIGQLITLAAGKPVHAIAVSPAKVERLAGALPALSCLFMNRREATRLSGLPDGSPSNQAAEVLRDMGLGAGVITAGAGPVLCFQDPDTFEVSPPALDHVGDVTGAGDALAGATAAALMRGLAFAEAVREGMAAAKLVVESMHAAPETAEEEFRAALEAVPRARQLS